MKVETYYADQAAKRDPYITRISFTGSHVLHIFHRGDADADPHDHRRAFITFPLVSYVEEVYVHGPFEGRTYWRIVRAWRPHFRGRRFIHRVIGKWSGERDHHTGAPIPNAGPGEVVTFVWWIGRKRPTWGFWCWPRRGLWSRRGFVPWDDYIERGVRRHG